jgi:dihydrofolate synthase / folylpolyglutamate synthase
MSENLYKETIKQLYDLQQFSVKQGLDNIGELVKFLNHPEKNFPVLHVAGTNGKGSTSVILQKILIAHGLRTGLYTSPHLIDFRERIRINNEYIEHEYIVDYWKKIASKVVEIKATFFDTTTALAFNYFSDQDVDVAVIETGLGGRLDSTNIVDSTAAIITPIHRDHIKQLGTKLKEITAEKADIIKNDSTVFCGKQSPYVYKALKTFHQIGLAWHYLTESLKIDIYNSSFNHSDFSIKDKLNNTKITDITINLAGHHQVENAALAYLVARWYLKRINMTFDSNKFKNAIKNVQWPGRFQLISNKPRVVFDVSHNLDGFRQTIKIIRNYFDPKSSHLLLGLLDDKEYKSIATLISDHFSRITITEPDHERPLEAEILKKILEKSGSKVNVVKKNMDAFDFACKKLSENDTLFVMGSHFLIGALSIAIAKRT